MNVRKFSNRVLLSSLEEQELVIEVRIRSFALSTHWRNRSASQVGEHAFGVSEHLDCVRQYLWHLHPTEVALELGLILLQT